MRTLLETRIFLFVFYLGLIVSCSACKKNKKSEVKNVVTIPVKTEILHSSNFQDEIDVSARIDPVQDVIVSAEAPGQVLKAPFEENERIKKGDLLISVDAKAAKTQVSLLNSGVKQAEREFARVQRLAAQGLATPQQVDQLSSQVDQAKLNVARARVALSKYVLRAPISGYIVKKFVEIGSFVGGGSPVAKIIDYDTVKIMASIPESEIGFIKEKQKVKVFIPSLEKELEGEVYTRSVMAHQASRTFDVDIRLDNNDHTLLPGMRAKVFIRRKELKNVILVRQSAILQGFYNQEAMVLNGNKAIGTAERRIVKTGPTRGAYVVVLDGLHDGDRLIVEGHRRIVNGTLVEDYQDKNKSATTLPAHKKNDSENEPTR